MMSLFYVFFITMMSSGVPENLPIGIVDQDNTSISRRFAREIDATQNVAVIDKYPTHQEARDAMQRGEICAFLEIPAHTYENMLNNRRPHICYYVNSSYMVSGTFCLKSLMTMVNLFSASVHKEVLQAKGFSDDAIMGIIQPINIDAHLIGNPLANYSVYLLPTIFQGALGLIILLMTAYSIGVEIKDKTSKEWMFLADNSIFVALGGKLLPYTLIYFILELVGVVIMYEMLAFPMNGSIVLYMVVSLAFILCMQAIGVFIIGIIPAIQTAVCICTLYGILSIPMSGFTFPVSAMYPAVQGLSVLFPLRHYYLFSSNETLFGNGFFKTYVQIAIMLLSLLLPFFIMSNLKQYLLDPTIILKGHKNE
jgi:ABC-2 type transporter.